VFLSGHFHLLVSSQTARHLSDYMQFVDGNIAREIGKLHGWSDRVWQRRYSAATCNDEESQIQRLGYLLAHGEKEALVAKAHEWPGVHTIRATCGGEKIKGVWIDRTALFKARRRSDGASVRESDFRETCTLTLSPLPCWKHLDYGAQLCQAKRAYKQAITDLGPEPDAKILGVDAILDMDPTHRPDKVKRGPAPLCHASTQAARKAFRKAYYNFVRAYQEGLDKLRGHLQDNRDEYIPWAGIAPGGLRPAPS